MTKHLGRLRLPNGLLDYFHLFKNLFSCSGSENNEVLNNSVKAGTINILNVCKYYLHIFRYRSLCSNHNYSICIALTDLRSECV